MKTLIKPLGWAVLFFISQLLTAQVITNEGEFPDDSDFETPEYFTRSFVKVNLPSFFVKTYSFQYEFFPVRWMSLGLSYKTTPERDLVFKDKIIDIVQDNNDINISSPAGKFLDNFLFKGSSFTPEIRFYLGKGYGKGFYLGPMIRTDNYKFTSEYFLQTIEDSYNLEFTGDFKAFGYGLILGTQYPLGKYLTLDIYLAPYITSIKIDANSTYGDHLLTDEEVAQLQSEIMEIELPTGETEVMVGNSSAKVKMTAKTFPNLRAGLGFGFRF